MPRKLTLENERGKLLALAEALEGMKSKHDRLKLGGESISFRMNIWFQPDYVDDYGHSCGTVACLAGSLCVAEGYTDYEQIMRYVTDVQDAWLQGDPDAQRLWSLFTSYDSERPDPKRAACAILNYLEGDPDPWGGATLNGACHNARRIQAIRERENLAPERAFVDISAFTVPAELPKSSPTASPSAATSPRQTIPNE